LYSDYCGYILEKESLIIGREVISRFDEDGFYYKVSRFARLLGCFISTRALSWTLSAPFINTVWPLRAAIWRFGRLGQVLSVRSVV
jgi:hypothetical protein